jgi:excisionase family DNA binding protein
MPFSFVSARELAARLGVRYQTILGWAQRGKIPHLRDGRGRLLFNLDHVYDALRQPAASVVGREGRSNV